MTPRAVFSSTTAILNKILEVTIPPAVTTGTTIIAHQAIDLARDISDSGLRATIKNLASSASSVVSTLLDAHAEYQLIEALIRSGVWKYMNLQEKALVISGIFISSTAAIYSASRIGAEKNTLAAGMVAAFGCQFVANIATQCVKRVQEEHENLVEEERQALIRPAV